MAVVQEISGHIDNSSVIDESCLNTTVAACARVIGALSCSHTASRRIEVARS
jgi:hypothetical protein